MRFIRRIPVHRFPSYGRVTREFRVLDIASHAIDTFVFPPRDNRSQTALAIDCLSALAAVAERDVSLLGSLSGGNDELRVHWPGVRAVAVLHAFHVREGREMQPALNTWPPEGVTKLSSRSKRLEAFIAHTLGLASSSPLRLPPFLFQTITHASSPLNQFSSSKTDQRFGDAVARILGGDSPREAFRDAYQQRLALTPAATRALLELTSTRTRLSWEAPLSLLRVAQIDAMLPKSHKLPHDFVALRAKYLLPPTLCKTAAEDAYFQRAAHWILQRLPDPGKGSCDRAPDIFSLECTLRDAQVDMEAAALAYPSWPALADAAFFLHHKYEAANAKGGGSVPEGFAPWAGMTLRTLSARAEAYRASVPLRERRQWRLPLYSRSGRFSDAWEGDLSIMRDVRVSVTGTWRAQELTTEAAIKSEGAAQRNCLRTMGRTPGKPYDYWSLQFTPGPGQTLPSGGRVMDRLTVELKCVDADEAHGTFHLEQIKARENASVHVPSLLPLLERWQAASGITISFVPRHLSGGA